MKPIITKKILIYGFISGLAAGMIMVPFGLFYKNILGLSVNVYGELLVVAILGESSRWAIFLEHFIISGFLAIPYFVAINGNRHIPRIPSGLIYGMSAWILINSLALPFLFSRPTPWVIGWNAIWPSLSVHLVYGLALGTIGQRKIWVTRSQTTIEKRN